ncbi:hypothetical protein ACFL5T_00955 [Gemmatimonadota bacterium]
MTKLKELTPRSIGRSLDRAEHCRLRNEPWEAESICLDVLEVEPEHQEALVRLILSLTDQFQQDMSRLGEARAAVGRLKDEYALLYYSGIIEERAGKAHLTRNTPGSGAYRSLQKAMEWYEKAEAIRPLENDDAILRWNTCVRQLTRLGHMEPVQEEPVSPMMLE